MISESKAFLLAVETIKEEKKAKEMIDQRYSKGIPVMEDLKGYPSDSLGGLFYKHIYLAKLDLYPSQDMSSFTEAGYIRERRRELHDVLHVVLRYETSLSGEACLNTFLAAGSPMPVCLLIPMGIIVKTLFKSPKEVKPLLDRIAGAWQLGKTCESPFAIKWEELFSENIAVSRKTLGVS